VTLESSVAMLAPIAVSLVLGWIVGFERYFKGRASGTQVYCLVSMASCAVTVFAGRPALWYGGTSQVVSADPTHVVGNILTGIGFLGAGIIVQSGTSVRGLTTAASVWATAAIGLMVGVGFYVVAVGLTALFLVSMTVVTWAERKIPARCTIVVSVRYQSGYVIDGAAIVRRLAERGLDLQANSASIHFDNGSYTLHFTLHVASTAYNTVLAHLAREVGMLSYVKSFDIAQSNRT
jgi:putative Mg2+ transporter-C (MgtC) family protein